LGIVYSGQNSGLAIGPLIVGEILIDEKRIVEEYHVMSMMLGVCASMAVIDAIIIWVYDKKRN